MLRSELIAKLVDENPELRPEDIEKVVGVILDEIADALARGDRVAQLVLAPVVQAAWSEVEELDATERGSGGFGSTGGHAQL